MGANFPAKKVTFRNLTKWDGCNHRLLSSGEYVQMSGRPGRSGLDERGMNDWLEPVELHKMLKDKRLVEVLPEEDVLHLKDVRVVRSDSQIWHSRFSKATRSRCWAAWFLCHSVPCGYVTIITKPTLTDQTPASRRTAHACFETERSATSTCFLRPTSRAGREVDAARAQDGVAGRLLHSP